MLSSKKSSPTNKKAEELLYYVIWQRIALYSDELTLFNLGGVAKIFREIVDDDSLWVNKIPQGVALAQLSADEMKTRCIRFYNNPRAAASTTTTTTATPDPRSKIQNLARFDFLIPKDLDLDDPKSVGKKIDEIEDVIAALIERSRTRQVSFFVSDNDDETTSSDYASDDSFNEEETENDDNQQEQLQNNNSTNKKKKKDNNNELNFHSLKKKRYQLCRYILNIF